MITTQKELRATFWETFQSLTCKRTRSGKPARQNKQLIDTRVVWVNWLDALHREGTISDKLAGRATL